ncbi:MAG: hypothetical protein ACLUC0_15280 [Clostridium neonatale]|nr:hypothetical protein [Clostridium neonatale]
MPNFNDYLDFIEPAFVENPAIKLEALKDKLNNINVTNIDIIKLSTKLKKLWDKFKNDNIQLCISITNVTTSITSDNIFDFDFLNLIKSIKSNGHPKSINFLINIDGTIVNKLELNDPISIDYVSMYSLTQKTICFFLSFKGIDTVIEGILFDSDNHVNSYKDIASNNFLSIFEYSTLLNNFFISEVQYDPDNYFFAQKNQIPKIHKHLLDDDPNLLFSAPEERFQKRLVRYLRYNCEDIIQDEVDNSYNDRYDIWIMTDDKKLFVIEIKWLGRSINVEGNISKEYGHERFLDGAYQLKEYIDSTDLTSRLSCDDKVHHGILLTYDSRTSDNTLPDIPSEFDSYSNLDLTSQHYILTRNKVKASNMYKHIKKHRKSN